MKDWFVKAFREPALLTALLVVVALLYTPGLTGPFLFDDAPNILDNAVLTSPKGTLLEWRDAAYSSGAGALGRPLPMLSFAAQLEDGSPASATAFKVVNLVLHCLCGIVLFLLVKTLLRVRASDSAVLQKWLPISSAALWLLNPLLLSTVLYPVQRMAQLSAVFVLLGLLIYAVFRARWAMRGHRLDELFACGLWVALCTVLAVFSKENGALLPWLILVVEVTLCGGRWAGRYNIAIRYAGVLLLGASLAFMAILLFWNWGWIVKGFDYRDFTLAERLWTEARVLWTYVGWFMLPRLGELGLFHDDIVISTSWFSPATTFLAVAAWPITFVLGLALRRVFPWLLMALLFFLVGHSLESGFLALELIFEHRNYLPSIALAVLMAASLLMAWEWVHKAQRSALAGAALPMLIVVFGVMLFFRAQSWSSDVSLASDSYARHPLSPRSAHFYANTLIKEFQRKADTNTQDSTALILARNEFEVLHNEYPSDLSALVMLYTLDSTYFPQVQDPDRWFKGIENSVQNVKLKATEYAAMRVLLACVEDGTCKVDASRLQKLLEVFSERYAYPGASAEMKLQLLDSLGQDSSVRIDLLNEAIKHSPTRSSIYYALIAEHIANKDFASANSVIIELLRSGASAYQLSIVDAMFLARAGHSDED